MLALLRSRPVCDIELERFLTALRFALLQVAGSPAPPDLTGAVLELCCALAQQCFINEYIFSVSEAEFDAARALRERVAAGGNVTPLQVCVVGSYFPLHTVPVALTNRDWPQLESVIQQQEHEPKQEALHREAVPALTGIDIGLSREVQQQYEENPYPRWTMPGPVTAMSLEEYLRMELPQAPIGLLPADTDAFDILIAGCGTGQHSMERALRFPRAKVLAIDLSRASLAYARRKASEAGLDNIDYAQADILALGSIGRTFAVIELIGVLHHLADPLAGWRVLVSLLRSNGLMCIGLYSGVARRQYTALRSAIAERGFRSTADSIRACRQDLISRRQAPHTIDFYSMSGCRDFLFNIVEHQHTIPQIKSFLDNNGLRFLGFEIDSAAVRQFREIHPDPAALTDLALWHEFELAHPRTFLAMYVFWVQKASD